MKDIILIMHRKAIVQSLKEKFQDNQNINLIYEPSWKSANFINPKLNAKVILIEVAESGFFNISYCLGLCEKLRLDMPECKLLLMCSEQDEDSIKRVVDAKWENKIDDFVFYDVTIDYLESKLISI